MRNRWKMWENIPGREKAWWWWEGGRESKELGKTKEQKKVSMTLA